MDESTSSGPDPLPSVDLCIKTFMRPLCLRRLVGSIAERYPGSPVNIADDSEVDQETDAYYAELERHGNRVLRLPFNVGASAGRNALVEATSRPYLLFLDDDFVCTDETSVEALVDVLEADSSIGVAGGSVLQDDGELVSYAHDTRIANGLLHRYPATAATLAEGRTCRRVDIVCMFALFRREVFAATRWDERLKSIEHSDFFLRLKQTAWKVVHVEGTTMANLRDLPPGYASFRHDPAHLERARAKWHLVGEVWHTDDARADRRAERRSYAKGVRDALVRRRMGAVARTLAFAASAEVGRLGAVAGPGSLHRRA